MALGWALLLSILCIDVVAEALGKLGVTPTLTLIVRAHAGAAARAVQQLPLPACLPAP